MKFSIITPTHKRYSGLLRAMNSLSLQTHKDWEMIIINDSPDDLEYADIVNHLDDSRFVYLKNDTNRGGNYSRNRGLDAISADSDKVILLDDDDYFLPTTLEDIATTLGTKNHSWLITERVLSSGETLTKFPHANHSYNYAWDYLILKKCKGDATHCINSSFITHHKVRFPHTVKQGEEWLFFFELGRMTSPYFVPLPSTQSDGYDEVAGLNFRPRHFSERSQTLLRLAKEGFTRDLFSFSFLFYLCLRFVRLFLPHLLKR